MKFVAGQKLLASVSPSEFVGREIEIERLLNHALGHSRSNGLCLLSAPRVGSSELLRQVFDSLFTNQEEIAPIYFAFKENDLTSVDVARRFIREFLVQIVAFRRRNAYLLDVSPDINEIAELALPEDAELFDRLIETAAEFSNEAEVTRFASFFSSSLRAASSGIKTFVILDDIHNASSIVGGDRIVETLERIFSNASAPFVLAGRRRFLFGKTSFETLLLDRISFEDSGLLVESLSRQSGVAVNDETRDLIAVQLQGDPLLIKNIFLRAVERSSSLDSFQSFEKLYADEIFGGRTGQHFEKIFSNHENGNVVDLLCDLNGRRREAISISVVGERLGISPDNTRRLVEYLDHNEIISAQNDDISIECGNIVLRDYLSTRHLLTQAGMSRAQTVGDHTTQFVKRAPKLMARFYRRRSAIGLAEILQKFDGRQIPNGLIDYTEFSSHLKGRSSNEIADKLATSQSKFDLPNIVFAANSAAFYQPISEVIDTERSAVALGFERAADTEEVWIAAEIESKLEASATLTEFWCDRLEMIAAHCDFPSYRIWLIAPEGFTAEALDVLRDRNGIGSSYAQVRLLKAELSSENDAKDENESERYEIVIPMSDESEMIAIHAVEEIARRNKYPAKAINQIKTALVEACINAAEHSLSPDRRITLAVIARTDMIEISVANRGVRVADKRTAAPVDDTGRRGWGITLIEGLMDTVRIEQTDDGTRLVMTKLIVNAA